MATGERQQPLLDVEKAESHVGRPAASTGLAGLLDSYFCVSLRGSTLATEIRAGTTAFLATSNNFVVNAQIMSHAGLDLEAQIVSGAFAAGVTCILSGLLSNLPVGLVPSVGPNVFLAYSLVGSQSFGIDEALGISAVCGALIALMSLTPALKVILGLMPLSIKYGLLVGTGLLTAFIGLKSIGVVVADTAGADIVALGDLKTLPVAISMISLVVTASMLYNAVKGAVLVGMLGATIAFWAGSGDWPSQFVSLQSLTSHPLSFAALAGRQAWMEVGALMLMLLFSLSGAVIGSARMAGLLGEDGRVRGSTAVFVSSGLGTLLAAKLGTAPIFVSMSAAAGVRDGGRTGLVSIVVGIYSLLTAFFLSPLASAIPHCAVSPVLVLVGVSMTGEAKEIQWWNIADALPAFLCAVFQPFTYSVSNGIYAGVGMSFVLFFTTGTFISYFPSLRKQELEVEQETADTPVKVVKSVQDLCALADEQSPHMPAASQKRMFHAKTMATTNFAQEAAIDRSTLRGSLVRIGSSTRQEALNLIEKAAALIGLDADQAKGVVLERLEAARNVESHNIGGIPGFETKLALREMSRSTFFKRLQSEAELSKPAQVASLARLSRMRPQTVPSNLYNLAEEG